MGPAHDPLAVQLLIDQLGRRQRDPEGLGPGGAVGVVGLPAALGARAMPGGEGDGLVVEVQERVVVRLPLLVPAAAELEARR